jgi:hypothetical protein
MMEPPKVCPFAAAHPQPENSDCLGEACASSDAGKSLSTRRPRVFLPLCWMRLSGAYSLGTRETRREAREAPRTTKTNHLNSIKI